jgi:hypothetical protein
MATTSKFKQKTKNHWVMVIISRIFGYNLMCQLDGVILENCVSPSSAYSYEITVLSNI